MFRKSIHAIAVFVVMVSLIACGSDGDSSASGVEKTGIFVDSNVEGLRYETASLSGETDENGRFHYVNGEKVKFYIGSFFLGEVEGNEILTPYSLYPNDKNAAITVARLLQSIDADKNPSNGITLVNQEVFDSLEKSVLLKDTNFESKLTQIGLVLDVNVTGAQKHLDETVKKEDKTAPHFTSSKSVEINENQNTQINIIAVDAESLIVYSIEGDDSSFFNLNSVTGVLTLKNLPDYETKQSYALRIKATDTAGNEATQNLSVKILDIDESVPDITPPTFSSTDRASVNENQTNALTLKAVDIGSTVSYSISGTDASAFNLNKNTGLLTFKVSPDYETKKSYSLIATATDISGNEVSQNISISIVDLLESVSSRSAIRTVDLLQLSQAQGKTALAYLTEQFEQKDKASYVDGDQNIFVYKGTKYENDTWASQFDFTGVAWNGVKAGTLITDQHIVLAAHYLRGIGEVVQFLNSDGITEERTVIAYKFLRKYDAELGDACIEKLSAPVSEKVKVYPLLKSDITNDLTSLNGAPYIMTDKTAKAFPEKILALRYAGNADYKVYNVVNWGKNSKYPSFMYHGAVGGDSGNPHFLYMNGELVIGSVLFGYGTGGMIGHFYGFQSMQDALTQAIFDMKDIH